MHLSVVNAFYKSKYINYSQWKNEKPRIRNVFFANRAKIGLELWARLGYDQKRKWLLFNVFNMVNIVERRKKNEKSQNSPYTYFYAFSQQSVNSSCIIFT